MRLKKLLFHYLDNLKVLYSTNHYGNLLYVVMKLTHSWPQTYMCMVAHFLIVRQKYAFEEIIYQLPLKFKCLLWSNHQGDIGVTLTWRWPIGDIKLTEILSIGLLQFGRNIRFYLTWVWLLRKFQIGRIMHCKKFLEISSASIRHGLGWHRHRLVMNLTQPNNVHKLS